MKKPIFPAYLFLWLTAVFQAAAADDLAIEETDPEGVSVPVAEQDLEADMQDIGPDVDRDLDEITEDLLNSEYQRYRMLMLDSAYDEADSVAKRVIELAIRFKGPRSGEMAKALTNLAIVQHHTGQYDAAQQNFETAVEIIEDVEDRLNAQLVNPLRGLAVSQLEGGRPDLASSTFQRAVHVTHVNEGPHNLGQVGLLESLTEVNVRLGLLDEARDIQDTIYAINSRYYKNDSMELIPSLMRRAQWQHRVGFVYDERSTYRRVIRIMEATIGKTALQLVQPLIRLGKSYFYLDTSGKQPYRDATLSGGEIHFKRAVRIAAEHPDTTWGMVTITTLALGDHFMHMGNSQRANQIYRTTWNLLSEEEERLDSRRQELESAVVLKRQPLPQYIGDSQSGAATNSDDPVLEGNVSLLYNVSIRGRATDVKLMEAEPPEFLEMQKLVQRELRRRVFRPRFFEANPVSTPDQVFVHTFFYQQSDLDALRGESAESDSEGS